MFFKKETVLKIIILQLLYYIQLTIIDYAKSKLLIFYNIHICQLPLLSAVIQYY